MAKSYRDFIKDVRTDRKVIPNFQREYVWKERDVKRLIGSILFKINIGAVLVFEDCADKLPYLYFSDPAVIIGSEEKRVEYVIDGQQRLTSLMIAFSDYYQSTNMTKKYKRKFFLKFGRKTAAFGLDNLVFQPLSIGKNYDYGDFTETNIDFVGANGDYTNTDKESLGNLPCEYFDNNQMLLLFLGAIASNRVIDICENSESEINSEYRDALQLKANTWILECASYIRECIDLQLEEIKIDESIVKAIKTYQIMNTSGQKLDTLDVLASHYSVVDKTKRLYDVIDELFTIELDDKAINAVDKYDLFNKSKQINTELENVKWSFYRFMVDDFKKSDKTISSKVIEQMIKLIKYKTLTKKKLDISSYKQTELLDLKGEEILANIEDAVKSISWSGMFMQIRLGIMNANRINNFWQLFVLSVVRIEIEILTKRNLDTLEAWLLMCRFTGRYRVDQNSRALQDIEGLLMQIRDNIEYPVLKDMYNSLEETKLNESEYTNKDILMCRNKFTEYKDILSQFISEFCTKDGYDSIMLKDEIGAESNVFVSVLTFPITKDDSYRFEIDHIHPLDFDKTIGETTAEIRNDKSKKYNSPINKTYLTKLENNYIRTRSYEEYKVFLSQTYKTNNHLNEAADFDTALVYRYNHLFIELRKKLQKLLRY